MINLRKHSLVALGYFFIVSVLGLILRLFFVPAVDLSFLNTNAKFLTHAHSHTALLGWIFIALITLIYKIYLKGTTKTTRYKRIYEFANVAAIGMLLTFPAWGYAPPSITFSTMYLIVSYFFSGFALKNIQPEKKHLQSWKLVKSSIYYLILSSLGAWAIGPITVTVGPESFWHNDSLYFFLHFLYSGFVFLGLTGILIYYLESKEIVIPKRLFDDFYKYINIAVVLTFFLSVLWAEPPMIFYIIGAIGAAFQIYGSYLLYKIIKPNFKVFKDDFDKLRLRILALAGVILVLKVVMQFASAFPYFADLAFRFKDLIIGYLHMVFLGMIVPPLLLFMEYYKLIRIPKYTFEVFLFAFFTTEFLIYYRGFASWLVLPFFSSYYNLLAALSVLFPIILLALFGYNIKYAINRKKLINDVISFFKLIY